MHLFMIWKNGLFTYDSFEMIQHVKEIKIKKFKKNSKIIKLFWTVNNSINKNCIINLKFENKFMSVKKFLHSCGRNILILLWFT